MQAVEKQEQVVVKREQLMAEREQAPLATQGNTVKQQQSQNDEEIAR